MQTVSTRTVEYILGMVHKFSQIRHCVMGDLHCRIRIPIRIRIANRNFHITRSQFQIPIQVQDRDWIWDRDGNL